MKRYDRRQTWITFTQRIGREHGFDVSRREADFILWEHTGFPSFWEPPAMESCAAQLDAFFDGASTP